MISTSSGNLEKTAQLQEKLLLKGCFEFRKVRLITALVISILLLSIPIGISYLYIGDHAFYITLGLPFLTALCYLCLQKSCSSSSLESSSIAKIPASRSGALSNNKKIFSNGVSVSHLDAHINALWEDLETRTHEMHFNYLPIQCSVYEKVLAPKETAVSPFFHANLVGRGCGALEPFIASQGPRVDDMGTFGSLLFRQTKQYFIIDINAKGEDRYNYINAAERDYRIPTRPGEEHRQLTSCRIWTWNRGTDPSMLSISYPHYKNFSYYRIDNWKEHTALSVKDLKSYVEKIECWAQSEGTPWIHGRGGVGRTGTLITALILSEKIRHHVVKKANLDQLLVEIILSCRKERGPYFVENKVQFNLLYEFAKLLLDNKTAAENLVGSL